MTTVSLFGVAGPFSLTNPLPSSGNGTRIVDKVTGNALMLPKGYIVTELSVRRRGTFTDPDLTAGKSVAVGLERDPILGDPVTDPRLFTGTPGALTDELNSIIELVPASGSQPDRTFRGFLINLNATQRPDGVQRSALRDRYYVCQCALGSQIDSGALSFLIKHKPFSESVAVRYG